MAVPGVEMAEMQGSVPMRTGHCRKCDNGRFRGCGLFGGVQRRPVPRTSEAVNVKGLI
jgi:hypothetical protein